MTWKVLVTIAAQRSFDHLEPTSEQIDEVAAALKELEHEPEKDRVPFLSTVQYFFDAGGFRIVFEIHPLDTVTTQIVVVGIVRA